MNEQQAQAQILQMKGFILKEAEEKRDELLAKANEECALERQKIVLQEKKKIQQDYDRKVCLLFLFLLFYFIFFFKYLLTNVFFQKKIKILKNRRSGKRACRSGLRTRTSTTGRGCRC